MDTSGWHPFTHRLMWAVWRKLQEQAWRERRIAKRSFWRK